MQIPRNDESFSSLSRMFRSDVHLNHKTLGNQVQDLHSWKVIKLPHIVRRSTEVIHNDQRPNSQALFQDLF